MPLVDDEDVVDTAALRDAKPLGILRVAATWRKVAANGLVFCSPQKRIKRAQL